MDTEAMVERARRIAVDGKGSFLVSEGPQVAAVIVALDDARVALRDAFLTVQARAERAERERDEERRLLVDCQEYVATLVDWKNAAEARVAALEGALQQTAHTLHDLWRCNTDDERRALSGRVVVGMAFGAHPSNWPALGDQEAPTEPPCGTIPPNVLTHTLCLLPNEHVGPHEYERLCADRIDAWGNETWRFCDRPLGHHGAHQAPDGTTWPAAPQVAPEPERSDEWRVVDDEGLVCCTEIDDLDDAHATAEMLDRDNPPDRHYVERAVVTWERVPARWPAPLDAEPERCPTCRSDVRWKRGWMVFDTPCWDPWHRPAPLGEGEQP